MIEGNNWKEQLKNLKHKHLKAKAPGFYELSGGNKMKHKPYNDKTVKGLSKAIIDWIVFNGFNASKVCLAGRARNVNGKIIYCNTTYRKGTSYISAFIRGKTVLISINEGNCYELRLKVKDVSKNDNYDNNYFEADGMNGFIDWFRITFLKDLG